MSNKQKRIVHHNLNRNFSDLLSDGWTILEFPEEEVQRAEEIEVISRRFGRIVNDGGGSLIWPIESRPDGGTFSATTARGPLHTDCQYLNNPPELILLACVRAASDGGVSIVVTHQTILNGFSKSELTNDEIQLLSSPIWSWTVPISIAKTVGYTQCEPRAIVSSTSVYWKSSNLVTRNLEELRVAKKFEHYLETLTPVVEKKLTAGQILVCDNVRTIHGRSGFNDKTRKFWRSRIRLASDSG